MSKKAAKWNSESPWKYNNSAPARNLTKDELGSMIFGTKHSTIKECLDREIFGLPAPHYSYVKKVTPGLALFLFNYSDRKLHGVFEAVSSGQLNIYKDAWVTSGEGSETSPYPAQVRIRARSKCRPLLEDEIKPIIANNYYTDKLFWFELDKEQTKRLMALFLSSPLPANLPPPPNVAWKRNSFNPPPICNIKKTADEEYKDVYWAEYPGLAGASTIDAFAPEKKWSELFKPSLSSSAVKNGEVLEHQELLPSSKSDCVASSSNEWGDLPPEACYGAANTECDSDVPDCWEDVTFVDSDVKEILEICEQHHGGDSDRPNMPDMPSSDNATFLDGWGELEPYVQAEEPGECLTDNMENNKSGISLAPVKDCERDRNPDMPSSDNATFLDGWGELKPYVQAEEPGEFLTDNMANSKSGIALAPVEDWEIDRNELNETNKVVQENNYVLSEGVLTDAESSYFQYMITKLSKDIEELKISQSSQNWKIESLQQDLVLSKQETSDLKMRYHKLECLAMSSSSRVQ